MIATAAWTAGRASRVWHLIRRSVSWIALGAGTALIYSGWQREPGREELLALGFTIVIAALALLSTRYLK